MVEEVPLYRCTMCFQVHAFPHQDAEEIEEYCFGRRCDDGKTKMERIKPEV